MSTKLFSKLFDKYLCGARCCVRSGATCRECSKCSFSFFIILFNRIHDITKIVFNNMYEPSISIILRSITNKCSHIDNPQKKNRKDEDAHGDR